MYRFVSLASLVCVERFDENLATSVADDVVKEFVVSLTDVVSSFTKLIVFCLPYYFLVLLSKKRKAMPSILTVLYGLFHYYFTYKIKYLF
ncbi:hypothetical protein [Campylobacter pinnipediorum]|uniref:hypothetical protein n=1 Tax=Campylobacter pinnipediorum TaxID=1965231 RepID=UPI00099573E7|nr:hypothetical protein [Campylobacter pinnipediorum]OPA71467.1 hypothetical protein BB381_02935 [Campylobacter pinnipediorum subsp. caledonicus]